MEALRLTGIVTGGREVVVPLEVVVALLRSCKEEGMVVRANKIVGVRFVVVCCGVQDGTVHSLVRQGER